MAGCTRSSLERGYWIIRTRRSRLESAVAILSQRPVTLAMASNSDGIKPPLKMSSSPGTPVFDRSCLTLLSFFIVNAQPADG